VLLEAPEVQDRKERLELKEQLEHKVLRVLQAYKARLEVPDHRE
jgi:hypothetical protein